MADYIIFLTKDDLASSKFEPSIVEFVFANNRFCLKETIPDNKIKRAFGDKEKATNDFMYFEPEIERLYYDIDKGLIRRFVVKFLDKDDYYEYGLVWFNPQKKKYELTYLSDSAKTIDTKKDDAAVLDASLNKAIVKKIKDYSLREVTELFDKNFCCYKGLKQFVVDESKINDEAKSTIATAMANAIGAKSVDDISINAVTIDLENIIRPGICFINFNHDSKTYEYGVFSGEVRESEQDYGTKSNSYRDAFVEIACETFVKKYDQKVFKEMINRQKNEAVSLIKTFYRFSLEREDDQLFYEELGDYSFGQLYDNSLVLYSNRDPDKAEAEEFLYKDLNSKKLAARKVIDRFINSKPPICLEYEKDANDFLTGAYDLETLKKKGEDLIARKDTLPSHDTSLDTFKALFKNIKTKYEKLCNIDKEKISKVISLMNKVKDEDTYDKYGESIFDAIDDLEDEELSAIKYDIEEFKKKFGDVPRYTANTTIHRRVFIRKSALNELIRINNEQRDLKILPIVDDIVDQLKTLPGNELGRYLLEKGLNFPIKADRSIKKIRIMRHAKYRLLFVYGSDLDPTDRSSNCNSIYIFDVTEHKKDKGDLYKAEEKKPNKYVINDFIIYPRNKRIRIPECTSDQYKIASSYQDRPIVTFGCAGSGKTTVSIEQYVNIIYSRFNCESKGPDEIVYITFHRGLSEKVKNDLNEFKVTGNCFKLDEYYAYVLGETYDESKVINENVFISWFNKEYSDEELEKHKKTKRKKISPLLDKPDIARLLYTYYRGIFKGSKLLQDSSQNHLSWDEFKQEMNEEAYLSEEEKNAIYDLCVEFDDYAKKNELLSDNDYAIKVIRSASYGIKRTNIIIIDEVQDLTEIEIIATILTLEPDSQKIYFYGDPHQSINPNVFNKSTINRVYTSLGKTSSSESAPLTKTYRTNTHLISYLNQLIELRDEWIGLTKGSIDDKIEPSTEDGDVDTSWAGYVTNKALYRKIFETNPNSMIITPSELERTKLLEKYPYISPARVITIYGAKGMEWDTVIMYNMFTDYESYFMDMVTKSDKAKRSTIHRMTFNKYYVGCTRSTKSFVIVEENQDLFNENNLIFQTLLSSFAPIEKDEQINTYVLEDNTFDAWYKEALQNMDNDNTATFEHALAHARKAARTPEEHKLIDDLFANDPKILENYGHSFLKQGEYVLARKAFIKCNKITKKHIPYVHLTVILSGRELIEERLRDFLKHPEMLEKYPEVLPKLIKQQAFQSRLRDISNKLFTKEEK